MPQVQVDQAKLILNTFAATFQNNLVSKDVVTWNKFDGEFNDRNGLEVVEQVGPRYGVRQTIDGVADLTSGVQDTVFGSERFKINRTFATDMGYGDFVKIRDIGEARESEAIKNSACQLAEQIDAYIMNVAVLAANNWTGTPGNDVATYGDIAAGYTRLKEEGVEDADMYAVLSYNDRQALSETVVAYAATDSLSTGTFRRGITGEIDGIPTMFTQQLPTLVPGTHAGTPLVAGGGQNVNYRDVASSPAPGQYLTQTITIDGLVGTQTVKAGEVLNIAGVEAFDNRLGASLARLQDFTVVEDATAVGGAITLRVFPAMVVPGSGTGNDVLVNTAHATVTQAPADNAAVTFRTVAGTNVKPRAILQKGAIVVNTADLITPATGTSQRKALSKIPLSVRMWQDSDFNTGAHRVRFDVALSANIRDRRKAVRINGA